MSANKLLFWQPKSDYLRLLMATRYGPYLIVFLNYLIWVFFFYLSFLLVSSNPNTFWQLLLATVFAELVERRLKKKIYWRRPMFLRHDQTPPGLVDKWYRSGAFPSGHTIKALFFFLFIIQYSVFSPFLFLIIVIPLILFRVVLGFHYPADILGGALIGLLLWFLSRLFIAPDFLNLFIKNIFDFFFFIK